MLIALGFEPIKAAAVALVANTAPVAFGAIAIPIVTLARDHRPPEGRPRRDGRPPDAAAGAGRAADPRRHGRRRARHPLRRGRPRSSAASPSPSASSCARTTSRSSSPTSSPRCSPPARSSRCCRSGSPTEPLHGETNGRGPRPAIAGAAVADATHEAEVNRKEGKTPDTRGEIAAAFSPYLFIIVVFVARPVRADQGLADERRHRVAVAGARRRQRQGRRADVADLQVRLAQRGGHAAAGRRPADHAHAALQPGARDPRHGPHPVRAAVGDAHRRHRARARLRDEPVRPDDHARPVDRRRVRRCCRSCPGSSAGSAWR